MDFNNVKFNRLVHYICNKCHDPTTLGATKLNKILLCSDRYAYFWSGTPITGERYIKRQFGPVPAHILETLDELVSQEALIIRESYYGGYPKREFITLNAPDLSIFSAQEISTVDSMIKAICDNHTAQSISDLTHDKIWELADIGEEIPYETVFVSSLGEINEDDMEWAKRELEDAA